MWNFKYPYSNFHELNLDWILNEIKNLKNRVDSIKNEQSINKSIAINVIEYGADNTGKKDVTPIIQDIVNSGENRNIFFPKGTYLFNSPLKIARSVNIIGESSGWESANTNGSGTGVTTFISNGTECINIGKPGEHLQGASVSNVLIKCNYSPYGIVATSTVMAVFQNLTIRDVTSAGILLNCYDGILSQFNNIRNYDFIYGATEENNASAIVIDGGRTKQATQNYIENMRSLVKNGYGIYIKNSDNNIITKLFGGAYLGEYANNNYFFYANGKIKSEGENIGNICLLYNNEGGSVEIDQNASFNYALTDYVSGTLYSYQDIKRKPSYYNINKSGTNSVDFVISLEEFDRNNGLEIYGGDISIITDASSVKIALYGMEALGSSTGTLITENNINIPAPNYVTKTNSLITSGIDPKYFALRLVVSGTGNISLLTWNPKLRSAFKFEGRTYNYKY